MKYRNFDLLIERHESAYRARILSSLEGEASTEFKFPFSSLELENFILHMGQSNRKVQRIEFEYIRHGTEDASRQNFWNPPIRSGF